MSIRTAWNALRRLYRVLLPIRFSFITLLLAAYCFLLNDQGHDAIAVLAEDPPDEKLAPLNLPRLVFVALTALMALQLWYWSRQMLHVDAGEQPDSDEFPHIVTWLPRILGALAFVVVGAALIIVRGEYGPHVEQPVKALDWMLGALVVTALLFVVFTIIRRKHLHGRGAKTTDQRGHLPTTTRRLLITTLILGLAFFLAATFPVTVQRLGHLGTMSIFLLTLSLWISAGTVLVYLGMRWNVPILTFLMIVGVVISPMADNHVIETFDGSADLVATRPDPTVAFDRWIKRLRAQYPGEANPPVFIVATEGGGIRAGYWTATVLASLNDTIPGFRDHLFAISGVSGGSVGAAVYGTLLVEQQANPARFPTIRLAANEILAYDALAPTLAAMSQPDFVQRFIPMPVFPDRGEALVGGWSTGWRNIIENDRLRSGFVETFRGKEATLPSLFLNSTVVETGGRGIISNCRINASERRPNQPIETVPPFSDSLDVFDMLGFDTSIGQAAHGSARFTYISPAGTIRRNPKGNVAQSAVNCDPGERCEHIVDGGYLENSGSATASEVLRLIQRHPEGRNVRPHVIFIRYQSQAAEDPVQPETVANDALSPLRAFVNTREARTLMAIQSLLQMLETSANYTEFTLYQRKDEAAFPLGWVLAERSRNLMDVQMGPNSKENGANVAKIAALLNTQPLRDAVQEKAAAMERTAD